MSDIKSMGLYQNIDRIRADLRATGIGDDDPLTVDDLTPFDQYHYEGTTAVDDACAFLQAGPGRNILDIGAGLGGPARYIANRTGAQVTALELQRDLNDTGVALTQRCGLAQQVSHVAGDVLAEAVPAQSFDGIVSMLCFLHIPDRATLFNQCARALVPMGSIFIDDYFAISELTSEERRDLADKVFCPYVPSLADYVTDLEIAGFTEVRTVDKSADWTAFVTSRFHAFRSERSELVARYGEATVDSLDDFYETVAALFSNGRLGGLRVTARMPA